MKTLRAPKQESESPKIIPHDVRLARMDVLHALKQIRKAQRLYFSKETYEDRHAYSCALRKEEEMFAQQWLNVELVLTNERK